MSNNLIWNKVVTEATNILRKVAKRQTTITYTDLSSALSPIAVIDRHSDDMNMLLREISLAEVAAGRPMLSAVVVNADSMQPGEGFFTAADTAGKTYSDETAFWISELNAVHAHFRSKP